MFIFETGIICWFGANSFHFFISQNQFQYLIRWNIPFKRRCFLPIDKKHLLLKDHYDHYLFLPCNCFITFDDHYLFLPCNCFTLFLKWKTQRNVNEIKKVEQRKGKTTISWVKNMNQWCFYVWKYHKNDNTQHTLILSASLLVF